MTDHGWERMIKIGRYKSSYASLCYETICVKLDKAKFVFLMVLVKLLNNTTQKDFHELFNWNQ